MMSWASSAAHLTSWPGRSVFVSRSCRGRRRPKKNVKESYEPLARSRLVCFRSSFRTTIDFQLFGVNAPAAHVGGDFFDYCVTPNDEIVLVIADVSGKGIPAAILMAVSRTIVHNLAMAGLEPAAIVEEANRLLVENQIGTMYVTLFVAKYVPGTGEYTYANGAHLPPLHVSVDAQVASVGSATGTLVGIFPRHRL